MKKICIATGTRAEYGLLKPIIDKVYKADDLELQLVVTGMHLSTEFGLTYHEIEEDGYPITAKIEMLLGSDTPVGITKSMGVALIGFADFFETYKPDIVVILGDRYEMLMVATAAMVAKIPIAHIHGGERTEGLMDEAIRHSVTKMSHIHFTTTEEYRERVIQLGEQPCNVYNVGSLGIENIKTINLMKKNELEENLGFHFGKTTIMITFHPVTLEDISAEQEFGQLLQVVENHNELSIIFTKSNSDINGRVINNMIDEFVHKNSSRCVAYTSLGMLRYLSSLQYCSAVVGNSSSGIIEVPSFGIPTVNIGDRQKGRVHAGSVIDCGNSSDEIDKALNKALSAEFRKKAVLYTNPYEGKETSEKIISVIRKSLNNGINLKKEFYDLGTE
jgi:GDP/UDP-N,N'-diacetylbacillosamine 2-epimerase (hydrolysing)